MYAQLLSPILPSSIVVPQSARPELAQAIAPSCANLGIVDLLDRFVP